MKYVFFIFSVLICCSCAEDIKSIYYPVGNADIVKSGSDIPTGQSVLLAESHNLEDFVLNTTADYSGNSKIGGLTFKFDLKNIVSNFLYAGYNGVGETKLIMSERFGDGNFAEQFCIPVFSSNNKDKEYRVKFRLKGNFALNSYNWIIDEAYLMLSKSFRPYPPEVSDDILLCKGGMSLMNFDSMRRNASFDVEYDRWGLSFNDLYFDLFMNISGQKSIEKVQLRIDKESFFEIYEIKKE